ncbi:TonB family protein [Corticibacter populi]|uniref:TonB family protein n=1 Tax=Corticibacter populi TaxID=1550736 RepID=A0A3M6QIM1_9BURK|nr:TonB family protein [Corticibacter populi]RMX02571.1 TonB family protein [Corticibacter populi]RZS33019.1 protein TonB [Corticibacter populi]
MTIPERLRTLSPFAIALILSVLVHAVLLTIRFVSPQTFERMFSELPLEVILVNAETNERPEQAKAVAQVALAGGGDADQGRATSPLPYSALTSVGSDTEQAERREETAREVQNRLLAELRQQVAALPVPDPRKTRLTAREQAQEEKRLLLIKQLAEIERLVKIENERPKKRYISPATQDSVSAIYLDQTRNAIEQRGTSQFPTQNGRQLYGSLLMIVMINHDGSVLSTEVVQSSGNPALDRRAEAIVHAAGPFGPFSQAMRGAADQIGFISRFEFKRDATLATQLQEFSTDGSNDTNPADAP